MDVAAGEDTRAPLVGMSVAMHVSCDWTHRPRPLGKRQRQHSRKRKHQPSLCFAIKPALISPHTDGSHLTMHCKFCRCRRSGHSTGAIWLRELCSGWRREGTNPSHSIPAGRLCRSGHPDHYNCRQIDGGQDCRPARMEPGTDKPLLGYGLFRDRTSGA